ncbi:uncharacterized protein Gasu_37620 [Galdieria sulphuraria]|uniref:Uncharacterized protein n=1 Tax=Galdieria sulphuraria TaxID=130081 RepID=M2XYU8_GALSU|nr:uncharacterized protein Gasu_37620 [Galdieria sulphuraria]EME28709.1 hypothetical protein Gasu_37620 [Galdieria sulphuraria]|eukprot:XP_005705229.1 hypothetical protein Gasu_37620 [Galdieria sulphuraria]
MLITPSTKLACIEFIFLKHTIRCCSSEDIVAGDFLASLHSEYQTNGSLTSLDCLSLSFHFFCCRKLDSDFVFSFFCESSFEKQDMLLFHLLY